MGLTTLLFSFKGRIGRQQYILGSLGAGFSVIIPTLVTVEAWVSPSGSGFALASLLLFAWSIGLLWASFALQVKRVQDRDHDWAFLLVQLIPIAGPIWFFVEAVCLAGTAGDNRFGKDPLA
ncbi:DUF805 domain-containing protein [Burkholderia cenocepacia]|uniref:DUF805 domain-containing protein n=1 Tax=Burkholderia cenocepacia TaxID=95486 RepID=UPI0007611EDA|nr:DUF805 domain-containing protein [Burkholderia cenocepacia]KWU26350.1 hypothetical protein AS149_25510 [Burkholderia cenocepacia]